MPKQPERRRAAIYARVSTDEQTTENQIRQLRKVARQAGWKVTQVYTDEGISGANGRDRRPAFDDLCKASVRREFDVVMSWSVDRLGRSLQHLLAFLEELHATGTDLYLHQQGIDTTTPAGRMMFQMCGVFAEFERSMIQERVKAGLERARAKGKTLGRPKVTTPGIEQRIRKRHERGTGIRKIARGHDADTEDSSPFYPSTHPLPLTDATL